jgi:hypothetical protein
MKTTLTPKLSPSVLTLVTVAVLAVASSNVSAQRMDTENLNQLSAGKEKSITRAQIKNNTEKNYKGFMRRQSASVRKMMRMDAKKSKRINEGRAPHTKIENFFRRFKKKNSGSKGGGRK